MDTRQAILKAADHIEANPDQFNYWVVGVPDCGSPGCALGWIGYFLGFSVGASFWGNVSPAMGLASEDFYDRMTEIDRKWESGAARCSHALRLYADKYHPLGNSTNPTVMAEVDRIIATTRAEA